MVKSRRSSKKGKRKRQVKTEHGASKTDLYIVVAIFFLSLVVRLIYILEIKDSILFYTLFLDPRTYDQWALQIATESFWGEEVFYQPPLYPYFLGMLYRILGHNYLIPRLAQILIGSASCVILFHIGKRLFNRLIGAVAATFAALYWIFIYFDGELLIPTLILFLDLLLVLSLVYPRRMSRGKWLVVGLLLGSSAVARPNVLIFTPFVLLWLWLQFRQEGGKKLIVWGAFFVLGIFTVVLPVALRNYVVGRDLVLISSNGGINFFIGNNSQADGRTVWASRSLTMQKTFPQDTKPSQKSNYWFGRALQFIRERPLEWVTLLLQKLYFFWNKHEISSNKDIYYFVSRHSALLRVLSRLHFGILAPLAFMGMIIARKRWRNYLIIHFFIASYMISVALFFVNARYRVPIIPFLMLFGAYALCWMGERVKRGEYARLIPPLIIALPFFIIINSRLFGVDDISKDSPLYSNLGEAYCRVGQYEQAMTELLLALEIDPHNAEAHNNLGVAYDRMGRLDEARAQYTTAIEIDPDYSGAHNNLGSVYGKLGLFDEAVFEYRRALELNPDYAQAHKNLGDVYSRQEAYDAAIAEYRRALELDSTYVPAHNGLGTAYFHRGEHEMAMVEYRAAVRKDPDNTKVHNNLGNLYQVMGRFEQAIAEYRAAIRGSPDNVTAYYNMGAAYQQLGRDEEALAAYRTALRINPRMSNVYKNIGLVYLKRGEKSRAIDAFERALKLAPDDELVRNHLSRLRG